MADERLPFPPESGTLLAVMGGGDWADASVDHVVAPDGLDVDEARKRYDAWYRDEYVPRSRSGDQPKFFSFPEWLVARERCRKATEADVIEVWT